MKHLADLKAEGRAELVAAVDVVANETSISEYAAQHLKDVELLFVPLFTQNMPSDVQESLTQLVQRLEIDCIIISTDPECHKPYGLWAIGLGKHVIMDKPITTRKGACNSMRQASGIAEDYNELLDAYAELQTRKTTFFLINSHRRYHPGYYGTRDFINDIREKTGCPVTSLISTHCDGQWRLPSEVVEQHYHPFRYGYGKVSHSGYHFLDTAYRFFQAGWNPDKRPDEIEVVSTFVRPNDFMSAFTNEEHRKVLRNEGYDESCKYSSEELQWLMEDMGEMDAMIQLTFKQRGHTMAVAQLNLFHTGFARRSWVDQGPTPDLYKGCGRVKHEAHEIRSGPFQTIVIDSRQANDKHDRSKPSTAELGSDNHFEVQTWRNCRILGEDEPLKVYTVNELDKRYDVKRPGIYVENVKRGILWEALDFLDGNKSLDDLCSNLPDHSIPASLMSAAYASHVRRAAGQNPITSIDIEYSSSELLNPRSQYENRISNILQNAKKASLEPPSEPPI